MGEGRKSEFSIIFKQEESSLMETPTVRGYGEVLNGDQRQLALEIAYSTG